MLFLISLSFATHFLSLMLNTFKIVMETVTHSFKINLSLKEQVLFEIKMFNVILPSFIYNLMGPC